MDDLESIETILSEPNAECEPDKEKVKAKEITREDIEKIAKHLIHGNFLLTALEFHSELTENGRSVSCLSDFFSNPGNFELNAQSHYYQHPGRRSVSNLTLDSIDDFARYSDDGDRDSNERVAVLEFELRKARDTIKELRENITEFAAEKDTFHGNGKVANSNNQSEKASILPFEGRALNYLINDYLLKSDYTLTSITFADQVNDQDLDDWDDVGINTSQPPPLLNLFRDYTKHVIAPNQQMETDIQKLNSEIQDLNIKCAALEKDIELATSSAEKMANQIDDSSRELNEVKEQLTEAEKSVQEEKCKNKEQAQKIEQLNRQHQQQTRASNDNEMPKIQDMLEGKNDNIAEVNITGGRICDDENLLKDQVDLQISSKKDIQSLPNSETNEDKASNASLRFINCLNTNSLLAKTESRLGKEVALATNDSEDLVGVVARGLTNIAPNVLLNKREELIPIILSTVRLHPSSKVRDELLHMLFNLIKRPDEDQRRMIIDGFRAFAKRLGETRIEEELLPQCWEQIDHKFSERRLLVAETCGALAPFLPVDLQSSLLLSMLQQMISDDRNEVVKQAALQSLSFNLVYVTDTSKHHKMMEVLFSCFLSDSEDIFTTSRDYLLPVLSVWSLEIGSFQRAVFSPLVEQLKTSLDKCYHVDEDLEESDANQIILQHQQNFLRFISCTIDVVPMLFLNVVRKAPFADLHNSVSIELAEKRLTFEERNSLFSVATVTDDDSRLAYLVATFDETIEIDKTTWDELDWITDFCLPILSEFTGSMRSNQFACVESTVKLISIICKVFGQKFTKRKIVPFFEKLFRSQALPFLDENASPLSSLLLPLFVCGVLANSDEDDSKKKLSSFYKQSLVTSATQHFSIDNLLLVTTLLCKRPKCQDVIVGVLRETVVYPTADVRAVTATLFEVTVGQVSKELFISQVAPALITLSNDRDEAVRVATVPALGRAVELRTDKNLLEKFCVQLQFLMDDQSLKDNADLHLAILRTLWKVIPNADPKFREEFLVPRLRKTAELNSHLSDMSAQIEMAEELIQAYAALLCCFLSKEIIHSQVLPALRFIERDVKELAPELTESIRLLISDAEAKAADREQDATYSGHSPASATQEMKTRLFSGFSRLKDASSKPRMRELFKSKDKSSPSR